MNTFVLNNQQLNNGVGIRQAAVEAVGAFFRPAPAGGFPARAAINARGRADAQTNENVFEGHVFKRPRRTRI